jgi:CRP/FNR family transcriptional regulator, cyclic AMP receptor protein
MTTKDHLRRVPIFASLPGVEIEVLAATLESVSFAPGDLIFREGEPGDHLCIVLDGAVEIIAGLGTAHEHLLTTLDPGGIIGEMSLLGEEETRSASVRALAEVEALILGRSGFMRLMTRYPSVQLEVLKTLATRLRETDNVTIRELRERNTLLEVTVAELQARNSELQTQLAAQS